MFRSFEPFCYFRQISRPCAPELLERMQPLIQLGQWLRGQPVDALATPWLVSHQSGFAQHLEVLGDCGTTELERLAEFPRRQWLPGQNFQQLPPYRVRQSEKDAVGGGHERQYTSDIFDVSIISDAS